MSAIFRVLLSGLMVLPILATAQEPLRRKMDIPTTESECVARHGRWGKVGIPGNPHPPQCTLKTSDRGKVCHNPEDCEGYCLAPTEAIEPNPNSQGSCSGHFPLFGCIRYLQDGKVISICAD